MNSPPLTEPVNASRLNPSKITLLRQDLAATLHNRQDACCAELNTRARDSPPLTEPVNASRLNPSKITLLRQDLGGDPAQQAGRLLCRVN